SPIAAARQCVLCPFHVLDEKSRVGLSRGQQLLEPGQVRIQGRRKLRRGAESGSGKSGRGGLEGGRLDRDRRGEERELDDQLGGSPRRGKQEEKLEHGSILARPVGGALGPADEGRRHWTVSRPLSAEVPPVATLDTNPPDGLFCRMRPSRDAFPNLSDPA